MVIYFKDSGQYTCVASSKNGQDMTASTITIKGKPKVNLQSQLPQEMNEGIRKIIATEDLYKKYKNTNNKD